MKQKQSGSAHLIITIILVLALLGALGFIFWQNFINKKDATTTTTTTTATNTATAPLNDSLVVSQWGVMVPVKNFVLTDTNGDNIGVTTQAIIDAAKKINCSDTGIGTIFRTKSTADVPSYIPVSSQIGGYYYGYWGRSTAACTDSQGNPPTTLNGLMMDAEAAMKTAVVNTKAN